MKLVLKAAAALTLSLGIAIVMAYVWAQSDEVQTSAQSVTQATDQPTR
jgi:hypothetical protein